MLEVVGSEGDYHAEGEGGGPGDGGVELGHDCWMRGVSFDGWIGVVSVFGLLTGESVGVDNARGEVCVAYVEVLVSP